MSGEPWPNAPLRDGTCPENQKLQDEMEREIASGQRKFGEPRPKAAPAGWREAIEAAAKVAERFTLSDHIAHDMRTGRFPEQGMERDAIAAAIRALASPLPEGRADIAVRGARAVVDAARTVELPDRRGDIAVERGEPVSLPEGVTLGEFKPCVVVDENLGLTSYYHEDVGYFARSIGQPHHVDALLAMDDNRLVGVQFWSAPRRADIAAEVPEGSPLQRQWTGLGLDILCTPEQALQTRIAELETALATSRTESEGWREIAERASKEYAASRDEVRRCNQELNNLEAGLERADSALAASRAEVERLEAANAELKFREEQAVGAVFAVEAASRAARAAHAGSKGGE